MFVVQVLAKQKEEEERAAREAEEKARQEEEAERLREAATLFLISPLPLLIFLYTYLTCFDLILIQI